MSAQHASAERREQILGEVAEGLHLVFKETQRRTMAAEDNDEFVALAETLTNLARGVRQCLGWHAKLERERLAAEAGEAEREAEARAADVQERRNAIARKVTRRFNETWPDDDDEDDNEVFNQRLAVLHERLDDLSDDEAFLDQDPDTLIARLCEEFGVEPPASQPPRRLTSPAAAAAARGGPLAERSEERRVEGAGRRNGLDPTHSSPDSS